MINACFDTKEIYISENVTLIPIKIIMSFQTEKTQLSFVFGQNTKLKVLRLTLENIYV